MAIDALVKPLLRLPLFQGLKPLQLTEIVRRAGRIVYKPGDVLIQEGQLGDSAIVIVSGEALRMDPDAIGVPAESIVEGSMISELAMLVEIVHSATIVARTPVRALKISREDMHEQMAEDAQLARYMTDIISSRLKDLVQEIHAIDGVLEALSGGVSNHATQQGVVPWAATHAASSTSTLMH